MFWNLQQFVGLRPFYISSIFVPTHLPKNDTGVQKLFAFYNDRELRKVSDSYPCLDCKCQ